MTHDIHDADAEEWRPLAKEASTYDTDAEEEHETTSLPGISRRQVLQGAAAAGALGMLSGVGAAQEKPQGYIVGLEPQVGF